MKKVIAILFMAFAAMAVHAQDEVKTIEVNVQSLKSNVVIMKVTERGRLQLMNKWMVPEIQIADGETFQIIGLQELNFHTDNYHSVQSANTNAIAKAIQQITTQGYKLSTSHVFQSISNPESMITFTTYVFIKE